MSKAALQNRPVPVALREWRVTEIVTRSGTRSRHMWGHDIASDQGRASSAIIAFDPVTMIATTHSGSLYRLADQPGDSLLGKAAWEKWRRTREIVAETDVSNEYLATLEQQADTTITFTKLKRVRLSDGQ